IAGQSEYKPCPVHETGCPVSQFLPWASNSGDRLEFGPACSEGSRPNHFKREDCLHQLKYTISGQLFAQAPGEKYPGLAEKTVTDSSFYFVIWFQDDTGWYLKVGPVGGD
uniref:Uncharacterized protein n=1 Tax=Rhinolophus ferrumequinum TaxID=59479 RepID=A0A671EHL7_RHIFE